MSLANKFFFLQLFADGEGAADTGLATGESGATDGAASASASTEAPEGQEAAPPQDQLSFDDLLKNNKQYKADYDKRVSEAVQKRFKNQRDLQKTLDGWKPAATMLGRRYGLTPNGSGEYDPQEVLKAIEDDDAMYEDEAFKQGKTVAEVKSEAKLRNENSRLKQQVEDAQREQMYAAQNQAIRDEASRLQSTVFPGLDIDYEMLSNPGFANLVYDLQSRGFQNPVETAYKVTYMDDIVSGTAQYAIKKTKSDLSKAIASGSQRPKENGASNAAAGDAGAVDPSKLTLNDFARIQREAERGKRITFN